MLREYRSDGDIFASHNAREDEYEIIRFQNSSWQHITGLFTFSDIGHFVSVLNLTKGRYISVSFIGTATVLPLRLQLLFCLCVFSYCFAFASSATVLPLRLQLLFLPLRLQLLFCLCVFSYCFCLCVFSYCFAFASSATVLPLRLQLLFCLCVFSYCFAFASSATVLPLRLILYPRCNWLPMPFSESVPLTRLILNNLTQNDLIVNDYRASWFHTKWNGGLSTMHMSSGYLEYG